MGDSDQEDDNNAGSFDGDSDAEATDNEYYSFLNVPRNASEAEINAAYKKLTRLYHPDKHQDAKKAQAELLFSKLKLAHEVLSDPHKRAIYDCLGKAGLREQGWEIVQRTKTPREIREEYEVNFMDMFVTARPIRVHHFWLPVLFGLWYTFFSVIYWAAGGTGMCIPRCNPLNNTNIALDSLDQVETTTESCPVVCDHYVYPILDWGGAPALAVGTIFGGCLVIPVLQCAWYGVYRIRKIIFNKTIGNVEPQQVHPQKTSF